MNNLRIPSRKSRSLNTPAFKVMKTLSVFTAEELKTATPLIVTYIPNK